jgi:hypothetical protein
MTRSGITQVGTTTGMNISIAVLPARRALSPLCYCWLNPSYVGTTSSPLLILSTLTRCLPGREVGSADSHQKWNCSGRDDIKGDQHCGSPRPPGPESAVLLLAQPELVGATSWSRPHVGVP